jgi:BirA family biotin operon repressor/biotin-[acetyl-CoA-carboxylase] ligase
VPGIRAEGKTGLPGEAGRVNRFYVRRVESTGSTNDDVARILGEEQARGLVLVAGYQERGSGRKGRRWIAPRGSGLLCTVALPDPLPPPVLWVVPFWAALALAAAIEVFGVTPQLRWPNDVLIDDRKAAGILCVSRVAGDRAWAGCGFGVNVRRPAADADLREIDPPPAFLSDRADVDCDALLTQILAEIERSYDALRSPGGVVQAWERAAGVPGTRYRVAPDDSGEIFEATALRLLPGGSLLVDRAGSRREITLADARILR